MSCTDVRKWSTCVDGNNANYFKAAVIDLFHGYTNLVCYLVFHGWSICGSSSASWRGLSCSTLSITIESICLTITRDLLFGGWVLNKVI